jgi:dihydrofolate synthase/folylpolyglutamate synthase
LTGVHQVANAGVALAVLRQIEKLDYLIAWTAYGEGMGMGMVRWPARLQQIERGPLLGLLPEGSRLWVDGGHNEAAAVALAAQMKTWKKQGDMPLHIVVAMMQTKRAADFLKQLAPLSDTVVTTEIDSESKCWPASELAALATQNGAGTVQSAPDLTHALKTIAANGKPGRVLICGSLYLAGAALALNAVK